MLKMTIMAATAAAIAAAAACMPAHAQGKSAKPPRSAVKKLPEAVLKKEAAEQARIYQSRGEEVPATYVLDRSLLSYATTLLPGFDRSLAELGPADRWLDVGAGRGKAVLDYYGERYDAMHPEGRERRGAKAQAVAISIEDRRTAHWHQTAATLGGDKIRYLFGKRLREYSPEELGKFKLATDVYGGFSYTSRLSLFMENILALLEVNGSFYTLLINVHPENWPGQPARPGAGFQTEILNADGSELKVCSWLKRISCVQVACETDPESETPIERYQVRKICDRVAVPALDPVYFSAGTPPARQYQLLEPISAVSEQARAAN